MNKASEILLKHEDDNEFHFHNVDRKWIIEAMIEYAEVSSSLLTEFGIWNTKDEILVSKYKEKSKAKRICEINSRMSGKFHKVVKVVVLDCY